MDNNNNRNKTHFFKIIYVYDVHNYRTLYKFTCKNCINRTQCRHHFENIKNCSVEYDLDRNKNINSVLKANSWFGNQYFI